MRNSFSFLLWLSMKYFRWPCKNIQHHWAIPFLCYYFPWFLDISLSSFLSLHSHLMKYIFFYLANKRCFCMVLNHWPFSLLTLYFSTSSFIYTHNFNHPLIADEPQIYLCSWDLPLSYRYLYPTADSTCLPTILKCMIHLLHHDILLLTLTVFRCCEWNV